MNYGNSYDDFYGAPAPVGGKPPLRIPLRLDARTRQRLKRKKRRFK